MNCQYLLTEDALMLYKEEKKYWASLFDNYLRTFVGCDSLATGYVYD